jgi:glutathione peroxidase
VPLYAYLTSKDANEKTAGEIKWNFTKFLINRNGDIVSRFEPKDDPASADFIKAIETELDKK